MTTDQSDLGVQTGAGRGTADPAGKAEADTTHSTTQETDAAKTPKGDATPKTGGAEREKDSNGTDGDTKPADTGAKPADADAKPTDADGAKPADGDTTPADAAAKPDDDAEQPDDPWSKFAPAPEPTPTRVRRFFNAIGRGLIHEWTLATFGSLLFAVVMTWPALRYPQYTIPHDTWDPTLQAWQMAWSGHILLTDPAQLWHANAFYPESWSFAFSDTLLGYAPAGMLGDGPVAAVLRYNIMFVLAHALAMLGAYALVRQLGSGRIGAATAGVAYAYAPWLLAQAGHLHVLSNGGIPLALAMLARGHGWSLRRGYRPPRSLELAREQREGQPTDSVNKAEKAKDAKATESAVAAEGAKPAETSESAKVTENAENAKNAEAPKTTENAESAEGAKDAEKAKSADNADNAGTPARPPRERRAIWVLGGWLVAIWQLSLGFGIGLPFAYVLGLIMAVVVLGWLFRRVLRRPRRPVSIAVVVLDVLGAVAFAAVGVLLSLPYFKVADLHPNAVRTLDDVAAYSPPLLGFFTAPAESLVWGDLHAKVRDGLPWPPEMTLLPGFVLYALAIAGLFFSIWTVRQRLLLLAGVLISGVLAMGTWFFDGTYTYALLFEYVPGWNGLRTPGRLMLWTTLLLGILAAGAISAFGRRAWQLAAERVPPRPGPWLRLATLLPLLLVAVEGLNTTPHPIVPQQPAAMRTVDGPLLVLPSSQNIDQHVMLWSTTRFQDIVNGGSGFTPRLLAEIREITRTFPDTESVQYLRDHGIRTVVLLRDQVAGTPWQTTIDLPVDSLGIEREDLDDVVVFRL